MLFHHTDETGTYVPADVYERAEGSAIHAPKVSRWHGWATLLAFVTAAVIVLGVL